MFCPKCGKDLPDNSKFCKYCGSQIKNKGTLSHAPTSAGDDENGKNIIIPDRKNGKYKVTKDGVSGAREVFFKDPIENIGAQLAKQAAEKTVEDAGDGTTTATVLTTAFVNNLKDFDFKDINKAFDLMHEGKSIRSVIHF